MAVGKNKMRCKVTLPKSTYEQIQQVASHKGTKAGYLMTKYVLDGLASDEIKLASVLEA